MSFKEGLAAGAFALMATGASADTCDNAWGMQVQRGEVSANVAKIDPDTSEMVQTEMASAVLDAVTVNGQTLRALTSDLSFAMIDLERDYGLSTNLFSHGDGILISDYTGVHVEPYQLVGSYAFLASEALDQSNPDTLNDFMKLSNIARDLQEIADMATDINTVIVDATVVMPAEGIPVMVVGSSPACLRQ